jgi:hypothetical protein
MLDASALSDLSHGDRLQRELALTFARALHSHTCSRCRMLRVCTVVDCAARKFPVMEHNWECFVCCGIDKGPANYATLVEWAADEPSAGGDE